MSNQYIATLEEDPITKELMLPFSPELMVQLKWEINDTLDFKQDGATFIITNLSLAQRNIAD